ncbi:hypothetical protein [Halovivax gelatinilyticus]|uniref:hypothetical protein n=1 Tax=Halovivax gelatinilyticus TaxID=2961597 RepID=UPI0020CA8342|nr:hypothetical protein [Halovivax gelatinilyticus]
MNVRNGVTLGVLVLVLFVAILSANVLVAADRTVLDAEYAADTAEEAELYDEITAELHAELRGEADVGGSGMPTDAAAEEILESAISSEYVQGEVTAAIEQVYAYLHGETDELRIIVDTEPVKAGVLEALEAEFETLGPADVGEELSTAVPSDLGEENPGVAIEEMAESESRFVEHREAFEERAKERIQEETPYPMTDEQLDAAYEDEREEIRAELVSEQDELIDRAVADGALDGAYEAPVRQISQARIDAVTGEIGYDEYVDRVESATADVRAVALEEAAAELDAEFPETVDLSDEFGADEASSMETAQTATSTASTLAFVLPLLGLALVGAVAYLWPASTTAIAVGAVSAVAGLVGVVASRVTGSVLDDAIGSASGPDAAERFVELLLGGMLDLLTWQSGGLLIVGVGLVGLGIAIRRGLVLPDLE